MFAKMLNGYKVSVKPEVVQKDMERVIVQFHRFPGTNSTVAHASLDGFELALESSPCVDPRNFSSTLGEKYSKEKVLTKANEALWKHHGAVLLSRLGEYVDDEEFIKKFADVYNIVPVQ